MTGPQRHQAGFTGMRWHIVNLCHCVQGLAACTGCRSGCYQCAPEKIAKGEHTVLSWDLGEIYGASSPTSLPSPTTNSLARTVLMWPEAGLYSRLHIKDAERAQGMQPGHTELPGQQGRAGKTGDAVRFKCVGNALPGQVSSRRLVYCVLIVTTQQHIHFGAESCRSGASCIIEWRT